MSRLLLTSALALTVAAPALAQDRAAVVETYADIAEATYADAATAAHALQDAVAALVADPSDATLAAARDAWREARLPYQQSEAFRFGNPVVDDWEGKVNAWPLDEGFIDYVDPSYGGATDMNEFAALNVVGSPTLLLAGQEVDATEITPELIADTLNEADGIESNVARGYHAIEFLLWGQDLNGTGPGAGDRPYTDYAAGDDCTGGNCDRRAAYLTSATALLVDDLDWMTGQWGDEGAARAAVTGDADAGIAAILTGLGSLSYGELAGERMRLGLMLNDPEEEHDCFSDNTHMSHWLDVLGMKNVWTGHYERIDGSVVEGPSLQDLVAAEDPALADETTEKLDTTFAAATALREAAEGGMAYDQMLAQGNAEGEALVMGVVNGLIDQTRSFERVVSSLDLDQIAFEGSDSLDSPAVVFQ